MGKIVGAFATSHVLFQRGSAPEQADRVFAGMQNIGNKVRALRPDLIVIVSNDHMTNFNTTLQPPFAIGLAANYQPFGDLDLPAGYTIPGNAEFAQGFVEFANAQGYDIAQVREVRPDHGVAVPCLFSSPEGETPIVPLYTNIDMRPAPSPGRCYALGELLGRYIAEQRPAQERVVVFGSGGLSHWIGVPDQGKVNADFDHWQLELFEAGRGKELTQMSVAEIEAKAGNGGVEVVNWLIMLGAVGGARAQTVFYEPMTSWWTGMAGIEVAL